MISFKIGGRNVSSKQLGNQLKKAAVESAKKDFLAHIKKQTSGIRDPKTGGQPRFRIKGDRLDRLSVEVVGSEELIKLVEKRLR